MKDVIIEEKTSKKEGLLESIIDITAPAKIDQA